jgi:hypothetical protein
MCVVADVCFTTRQIIILVSLFLQLHANILFYDFYFYIVHVNTRIFLALTSHVKPLHGDFKVHGATN